MYYETDQTSNYSTAIMNFVVLEWTREEESL
jgi:hypothetical protein